MENTKVINGFTQISNAVILDPTLSFKAKGIYLLMASRPSDWVFNVKELANNSNKGLSSFKSGLKELRLAGYIQLNNEYDIVTRKFKGRRYTLTGKHRLSKKSKIKKAKGEDRSMENNDLVTGTDKDISFYLEELVKDYDWIHPYIEMPIAPDVFLDQKQIQILLQHFITTSLQAEKKYTTVREVKVHFANWLNKNNSNDLLITFIKEGKIKCRRTEKRVMQLLQKVASIIKTLNGKNCKNIHDVLVHKELLVGHSEKLSNLNKYQLDPTSRNKLFLEIKTIQYWIDLVERAEEKNQLIWFCQNDDINA